MLFSSDFMIDAVKFRETSWYWPKGCNTEACTRFICEWVSAGACEDYGDVEKVMLACLLVVILAGSRSC